jgi:sec-independent protein translocase protein TatA
MQEKAGHRRQESVMRLGLPELLVILFIVILIFGASRLPELGRGIGRGIKNFKDATRDGANDKRDA